jgi:hypothetical protein
MVDPIRSERMWLSAAVQYAQPAARLHAIEGVLQLRHELLLGGGVAFERAAARFDLLPKSRSPLLCARGNPSIGSGSAPSPRDDRLQIRTSLLNERPRREQGTEMFG